MDAERLDRLLDEARAEVSRREREHEALVEAAQKALAIVASERDEARTEVDQLRRERDEAEAEIDRLQDERNEAQDEIDRLRAEVERLRAALAQAQRADE